MLSQVLVSLIRLAPRWRCSFWGIFEQSGSNPLSVDSSDLKDTRNKRLTKCYTKGIKFNWNQCDYKTFRISSLKLHTVSEHLGIKPNCNECDFKAGSARSLKFHRASQHAGIKYDCDQCDYKSIFNESLKTHKMVKASRNEIYLQFLWLQSNNQIFT